jgi:hypothetical protein
MIDLLLFAVMFFVMITAIIFVWGLIFKIADVVFRRLGLFD